MGMEVKLEFELEILATHVCFHCKGEFHYQSLLDLIAYVETDLDPSHKRVLVDLTPLTGTMDTLTRYNLGVAVADKLADRRIAVLGGREIINKVAENTAVNRGAALFVTHEYRDAMDWLLLT
jgi:hypothetical protein